MEGRLRHVFAVVAAFLLACSPEYATAQASEMVCAAEEISEWEIDSSDPTLVSGIRAFRESRFHAADSLFRRALRNRDTAAEAWYLLARLNLDDHVDKPANASRFIRRAMALEPDNIHYIEERLRQITSGKTFFMGSDADTHLWANRILDIDSTEVSAYASLGVDNLEQYYRYRGLMGTNANKVLARMTDNALMNARNNLETALSLDPCHRGVYDHLIRLYFSTKRFDWAMDIGLQMQQYYSVDPKTWLYSAASAYFEGRAEDADPLFDKAFNLMDVEERSLFRQQAYFMKSDERLAALQDPSYLRDFWASRKPRYLTDVNERLLAHYARLVYADIFYPYWRAYIDNEWQITPGEVVLRWGVPLRELTYLDGGDYLSRYLTLSFQGRSVRFTDYTRNGEYFIIDTAVIPVDQALPPPSDLIAARDQIHFSPEAYGNEGPARTVDIPYLVSVLKREEDAGNLVADVIISLGIPIAPSNSNNTTFGRILDETNRESLDQLFLTLGSFLIDSSFDVAAEERRTYYGLPESGLMSTSGGTLWTTTHSLSASPGDYRVSVEFETLSRNIVGATPAKISVPSFDSDSLMLSDLVMAYSIEESSISAPTATNMFHRNGLDLKLAPWAVFSPQQPIYVYFEMYNLEQDPLGLTQLEFEVALVPSQAPGGVAGFFNRIFAGLEEGVAVRSSYSGNARNDGQYIIVDASEQPAGEYNLVVRLRDLNADTERQIQRTIFLEDAE